MKPIVIEAVGADPEVFFVGLNGRPKSSEGLLGGTKDLPVPMTGLPTGFFVQEDNVAAEWNIPPSRTAQEFSSNIQKGIRYLEKIADKNKLDLKFVSSLHFPKEELLTPHAKKFGCEPDFNVWTGERNPRPVGPDTLRTAAGHVHISWKAPEDHQVSVLSKYLDVVLGIPFLLVSNRTERRTLYGRAGCVRYKPYGVEYRVLGNEWLPIKQYRMHIFEQVQLAAQTLNNNSRRAALEDSMEDFCDDIQDTINDHNTDRALELMDIFDVQPFPHVNNASK